MGSFLRPTKGTWIAMSILLSINVLLGILGILTEDWHLFITPLLQIIWLYLLVPEWTSIDVTGRGDFISSPNFLGWLFIIIGSLISLSVYYFVSSLVSLYYQSKNIKGNDKSDQRLILTVGRETDGDN